MRYSPPIAMLAAAFLLATNIASADEPAVAETPEAAPAVVESRALDFARQDLARLETRATQLREAAKSAAEQLAATDKQDAAAVKAATNVKAAVDKELAALEPKLKAAAERIVRISAAVPKADPKAFREIATFKHDRPVVSVRFDPAGAFIYAGAMDNLLQKWDTTLGTPQLLTGHKSWIRGLGMHTDGKLLLSGDYTGKVIWWNPQEAVPKPLRDIQAHQGSVRAVSISPDGQLAATAGNDNLVRLWSTADGSLVRELPGHERHVYNVGFDLTGRFLVSGDLMGVLKQWDVATGKLVRDLDCSVLTKYDKTFKADCGGIRGMDFSRDGRQVVVCGISEVTNAFAGIGKPTAVLFDLETGERLKVLLPSDNFSGTCWSVRFDPAGAFIVGTGGAGSGGLWFWKPTDEKAFHFVKLPGVGYDLDFHPDGLRLAVGMYDQTVRIYDLGPAPAK